MAGANKRPEPEQRLSDTQRLAWLRLLRSENVSPATFRAHGEPRQRHDCGRGGRHRHCLPAGERGLLVSERAPGYTPRTKDFPRRNRLISGIALGVVVIEAAQRSGSLITARLAGEQGREVFAVPGSPLDPRAAGTNNLLKQGATLVTGPEGIIEALAPMLGRPAPGPRELSSHGEQEVPRPLPDIGQTERDRVIEALGPSPIDIDEVIRCTGIETRKVHIILLELDLAGRLQRHLRQLVSLIDP